MNKNLKTFKELSETVEQFLEDVIKINENDNSEIYKLKELNLLIVDFTKKTNSHLKSEIIHLRRKLDKKNK